MLIDWSKPLHIPAHPDCAVTVLDPNYRYDELGAVVLLKISQPGKADRCTARHPMSNQCPMQTDILGHLVIENAPIIDRGFYPLSESGIPTGARGLIGLDMAMSEYSSHRYFLEVVRTDGKPTEVHLHVRQ